MEPATVWLPKSGQGEFTQGSSLNLIDSSGVSLIDSSANTLIDSGSIFNPVVPTIWTENDAS